MNWNPANPDGKELPVRTLHRRFQGRTCHPCRRLTWWMHWGDQLVDMRLVRLHYGQPSQVDADFNRTKPEQFDAMVAELRTMVGREPFGPLLRRIEKRSTCS